MKKFFLAVVAALLLVGSARATHGVVAVRRHAFVQPVVVAPFFQPVVVSPVVVAPVVAVEPVVAFSAFAVHPVVAVKQVAVVQRVVVRRAFFRQRVFVQRRGHFGAFRGARVGFGR